MLLARASAAQMALPTHAGPVSEAALGGHVRHVFLYGALRDDDDSGAVTAASAAQFLYGGLRMPSCEPAHVLGYRLLQAPGAHLPIAVPSDAAVVAAGCSGKSGGDAAAASDSAAAARDVGSVVHGRLVGWHDPRDFAERLRIADEINAPCSRVLVMAVRDAMALPREGSAPREVPAFMYVQRDMAIAAAPDSEAAGMPVLRGDWLCRTRGRAADACGDAARELEHVLRASDASAVAARAASGASKVVAKHAIVSDLGNCCREALLLQRDGRTCGVGPNPGLQRLHALQATASSTLVARDLYALRRHICDDLCAGARAHGERGAASFDARAWGARLHELLTRVAGLMLDLSDTAADSSAAVDTTGSAPRAGGSQPHSDCDSGALESKGHS